MKIPDSERILPEEINIGDLFAAKINGHWERVVQFKKKKNF